MKKDNKRNSAKNKKVLKAKVIKLGFQADVVTAVEAIRFNEADRLALRLPEPAGDFEKFFNLRLLKQISLVLGKEIILITNNQIVIKLAEHLNIPTESVKSEPMPPLPIEMLASMPTTAGLSGYTASNRTSEPAYRANLKRNSFRAKKKATGRLTIGWILFLLIIGGVLVVLFVLWPKRAEIDIQTDISTLRISVRSDLSPAAAQKVDSRRKILPLRMISQDSKLQQEVEATGSTAGGKANGVVEVYNCNTQKNLIIDTQTVFRKDDKDFVLKADDLEIVIPSNGDPDDCEGSSALDNRRSLRIEAVGVGEEYNLEAGSYQIVGLNDNDYNARGFDISGGSGITDCITSDNLEDAKERFAQKRNDTEAKRNLIDSLEFEHDLIPLEGTFQVAEAEILEPVTCPDITDNRISQVIIYYLGGIKKEDVAKLVEPDLKKAAGGLTVIDNGLTSAIYEAYVSPGGERPKPTVQRPADLNYYIIIEIDQASAGIILDREDILDEIVGKKVTDAAPRLRSLEGVTKVDVDLQPRWPWIDTLPQNRDDILIKINGQEEDGDSKDE